jgi:adenine-specific DNA-methyltransferase
VSAAREAADAGFDVLIACAFNYDAHAAEFDKLGRIPVLKARMNADLHMAGDLKNTGKGNLFVIFGEPDIDILPRRRRPDSGQGQRRGRVPPQHRRSPQRRPRRHRLLVHRHRLQRRELLRPPRLLPGQNDPYKALKTTLKAEIDAEAWATLHSDVSRPFDKPKTGRIAVKVINHLGDEVMKVFAGICRTSTPTQRAAFLRRGRRST